MKEYSYEELQEIWKKDKEKASRMAHYFSQFYEFLKANREATVEDVKKALPNIPIRTIRRLFRQIERD
jgi:hypothetical protein